MDKTIKDINDFLRKYEKETKINGLYKKFKNINGKTAQNDVPKELYTLRTDRSNRVLLSWSVIINNPSLQSIVNLEKFENGVCVEFKNNEYDCNERTAKLIELKRELKGRLGNNDIVTCIRTIREDNNSKVNDLAKMLEANSDELKKIFLSALIERNSSVSKFRHINNDNWTGKYYFSVKTGLKQQKQLQSHDTKPFPKLFNPANEYANSKVCDDIYFVLTYFALHCYDIIDLCANNSVLINKRNSLIKELESKLKSIKYNKMTLFEYCNKPYYLELVNGSGKVLIDPISLKNISIKDFGLAEKINRSIELCHLNPASENKFAYCKTHGILSPARPDNLFWGFRESNLFQQTYTLEQYFKLVISRADIYKKYIK